MKSLIVVLLTLFKIALTEDLSFHSPEVHSIEGKVFPPDTLVGTSFTGNWQLRTRILANGGEFVGFLK